MSARLGHDGDAEFLGVAVGVLPKVLGLPIRRGGSVTLRRRKKARGLEPDKCYWIANAAKLAGRRDLDLRVDPAPDLAVEVDVTSSSLDRTSIYASLGVAEVWHLDGDDLTFRHFRSGAYVVVSHSVSFPFLTPADLVPFMRQAIQAIDENTVERDFADWVRRRIAPPSP